MRLNSSFKDREKTITIDCSVNNRIKNRASDSDFTKLSKNLVFLKSIQLEPVNFQFLGVIFNTSITL